MSVLEVKNLSLTLDGKKILDNLSLEFWEGYIHAVVGPNGAGKSSLASTIMGLNGYHNFDGDILFKGNSLKQVSIDERAKFGLTLSWQEPARFEGLSVSDFILASAKQKNKEIAENALNTVGLEPASYLFRSVDKTLSGGERKKIELASIMVMEPVIAMMDEPDSGIDIASIEKIFEVIKILKKRGTTIILITHSLAVLDQADHAFLICRGQLQDKGSVEKISQYFKSVCEPCDHKNKPDGTIQSIDKQNSDIFQVDKGEKDE
ncbi:MAG: ABC transporter ATP-binding protein [Desulfuromonas sp. SDB]|nr:MAG: ABC transporter ATP-binding protein [Desulfuromonas sp. SDB]